MYAIIDIETTGNRSRYGQITEISIIQHNGFEITGSFNTLIKPDMDIPWFITQLTGITNEMVRNAPPFYEVARKIVEMTDGRIFVAHNVQFDYGFIREEFKRLGYVYSRKTMCTVKLARQYLPGHKSYSLGKICSDLGIVINGRHRAHGDAEATVRLLEMVLERQKIAEQEKSMNYRLF